MCFEEAQAAASDAPVPLTTRCTQRPIGAGSTADTAAAVMEALRTNFNRLTEKKKLAARNVQKTKQSLQVRVAHGPVFLPLLPVCLPCRASC